MALPLLVLPSGFGSGRGIESLDIVLWLLKIVMAQIDVHQSDAILRTFAPL